MAANTLFSSAFLYVVDADGIPVIGAKATFFEAGGSTPLPVFSEPSLTTPWAQPVVTNAAGQSTGPIYISPTPAMKIVIVDANDVPIPGYPMDFFSPSAVAS